MVPPGTVESAVVNGKEACRSFTIRKHWFAHHFALAEARGWLRQSQSVPPKAFEEDLLHQGLNQGLHSPWSGELHLPVRRSYIRSVANSQPWSGATQRRI